MERRMIVTRCTGSAWGTLSAVLVTCVLLFVFPLAKVAGWAWPSLAGTEGAVPPLSFPEFLVLGGGYALVGLFAGGLLVGRWVRGPLIYNALVAACLYIVVIAPALGVVCIPLTAAGMLGLALGSATGGLAGGTVGIGTLARG
jgi:hypothetical protein